MHVAGKILGNICLKAIIDTFFSQYVVCDQRRDRGNQFFGWGDIWQKGKVQTFGIAGRLHPQFPLLMGHPDKENPEEDA